MLFYTRRCYLESAWQYFGSILLISLLFTSCKDALPSMNRTSPTAQQVGITPPTNLISPHILTVGIYANYFPQEYINEPGHHIVGFDIDVIQSIAERLHLRTRFVTEDYSTLINDLAINRFDVVISAVSITPELQKTVNFIPYFRGGESLLVTKGNLHRIYALPDLCGQKVAIKEATFEQREIKDINSTCLKDGKVAISVVLSTQYKDSLQQLLERNVVAIYQDSPVTDYFIKQNPNHFEVGGGIIGANMEGIAIRKSDTPLLNALQKTFAQIKADGSYRSIITRWGLISGDITSNDAKANQSAFAVLLFNEKLRSRNVHIIERRHIFQIDRTSGV